MARETNRVLMLKQDVEFSHNLVEFLLRQTQVPFEVEAAHRLKHGLPYRDGFSAGVILSDLQLRLCRPRDVRTDSERGIPNTGSWSF